MAERNNTRLWSMRGLFILLCMFVIFWRLLPLDLIPHNIAGPDLILALICTWVLRRPEYATPLMIAAIVLLTDLLFQRPPGLWTALVLLGSEALKSRSAGLRDMGFVPEWITVASVVVVITLANRLVLALLLVDQAPLGLTLVQMLMTILFYPFVIMFSAMIFGIRKIKPGDAESLGHRV